MQNVIKSITDGQFLTTMIGDCVLLCGDSMKIMPQIAGWADCVVSDPPYPLTSGGKSGLMRGIFDPDEYDNGGNLFANDGPIPKWEEFMPLIFDLIAQRGHYYIMANNRNVYPMLGAADDAGFYFHNLLRWRKGTFTANRWYMKGSEFTGFFAKGKAFAINNCSSPDEVYIPQVDQTNHPTEKPVMLMKFYIENSTQPGQIVADPFMGTGATAVACVRSGRKFIGVDRNVKFYEQTCQRVQAAYDESLVQQKSFI